MVGDGGTGGEEADVRFRPGAASATAAREEDVLMMVLQDGARRTIHWYLRADRFDPAAAERLLAGYLSATSDRDWRADRGVEDVGRGCLHHRD